MTPDPNVHKHEKKHKPTTFCITVKAVEIKKTTLCGSNRVQMFYWFYVRTVSFCPQKVVKTKEDH